MDAEKEKKRAKSEGSGSVMARAIVRGLSEAARTIGENSKESGSRGTYAFVKSPTEAAKIVVARGEVDSFPPEGRSLLCSPSRETVEQAAAGAVSASIDTSDSGSEKTKTIVRGRIAAANTKVLGTRLIGLRRKAVAFLTAPRGRRGSKQQEELCVLRCYCVCQSKQICATWKPYIRSCSKRGEGDARSGGK